MKECRLECQIKCQLDCQIECQIRCQIECHIKCQIKRQIAEFMATPCELRSQRRLLKKHFRIVARQTYGIWIAIHPLIPPFRQTYSQKDKRTWVPQNIPEHVFFSLTPPIDHNSIPASEFMSYKNVGVFGFVY